MALLRIAWCSSEVGEEYGCRDDYLFPPLHFGEHRLADGAQVWVHATDLDAQETEWKRERASDWNRKVHVLPAPLAEQRMRGSHGKFPPIT